MTSTKAPDHDPNELARVHEAAASAGAKYVCAEPVPDRPAGTCGTPIHSGGTCPEHSVEIPVDGFDWGLL